MQSWEFNELEAHELAHMMQSQSPDVLLIDVRGHEEVAQGAIPGATHVPLHVLPLKAQELAEDKTLVFYCHSGRRSAQACAFMSGRGHGSVINLRGGILAWVRSGQPIARPLN
jgi:rhodanese-related sulfurtransferase